MEMVERVARAICKADGRDPDSDFTSGNATFPAWQAYQSRARAAIEAMREPTEAMIEAGGLSDAARPYDGPEGEGCQFYPAIAYRAMIDAALAPQPAAASGGEK
jgi:hypothetical protein